MWGRLQKGTPFRNLQTSLSSLFQSRMDVKLHQAEEEYRKEARVVIRATTRNCVVKRRRKVVFLYSCPRFLPAESMDVSAKSCFWVIDTASQTEHWTSPPAFESHQYISLLGRQLIRKVIGLLMLNLMQLLLLMMLLRQEVDLLS